MINGSNASTKLTYHRERAIGSRGGLLGSIDQKLSESNFVDGSDVELT